MSNGNRPERDENDPGNENPQPPGEGQGEGEETEGGVAKIPQLLAAAAGGLIGGFIGAMLGN